MDYDPPFLETYKTLFQNNSSSSSSLLLSDHHTKVEETCELPSIDFGRLVDDNHPEIREECLREMIEACRKWGFFQLVNHGISQELLEKMKIDQMNLFHQPFVKKSKVEMSKAAYKWGNPFATNLTQLSWSEAFHVPLADISTMDQFKNMSIGSFSTQIAPLAERLVEMLAHSVKMKGSYLKENCSPRSCFVRLNRYPPCGLHYSSNLFGLLPHNDSSLLTIVLQDHVGGLQLLKDNGNWVAVNPNPQALIVNIGDLFQALSNGEYRSIKHRVVASEKVERFSVAYFHCPSDDAVIESYIKPSIYRSFTFREFRHQTQKDVKQTGDKVGLSRFLA